MDKFLTKTYKGDGKVYDGDRFLSLCKFRFTRIQRLVDTKTEPNRYVPGSPEIRDGEVVCETERPQGTVLILHFNERDRLPFAFSGPVKNHIEQRGDIYQE